MEPYVFGGPSHPSIRRAIRILEDGPFPPIASEALARQVGMSTYHFSRLFHAQVGKTVGAFARDMCLGQAAFRLKSSDAAIHDLFSDYGYGSQTAFTRAFTSRFGMAPAAFRETVRSPPSPASAAAPPPLDVRLHRRASMDGLLQRYIGPPELRGEAWRAFAAQVAGDGLGPGRWFGLMHDDPAVARPSEFRFDLGFVPDQRSVFLQAPGRYERYRTTAGFYGTVTYQGPYAGIRDGYGALLRGWLKRQTRFVIAGEPLIESFTSPPGAGDPAAWEADISIKLAVRGRPVDWMEGAEQRRLAEREWRVASRQTTTARG